MLVILLAFTLFHLFAGVASLGLAVRLLTPGERALWRSQAALLVAELLCWIYPIAALASTKVAWAAYDAGFPHAFPMILTPFGWLIVLGFAFAVVDFLEDGVLGNARSRET
jgi:hypothetical protein